MADRVQTSKIKQNCADMCSAKKNSLFIRLSERGSLQSMLDEVEISPMLHKVTGAGHSL